MSRLNEVPARRVLLATCPGLSTRRARREALAVFDGFDERLFHLSLPEVPTELADLAEPEVRAAVDSVRRCFRSSGEMSEGGELSKNFWLPTWMAVRLRRHDDLDYRQL